MDDCDECDIHAICEIGACKCRRGYKGDGFSCDKSTSYIETLFSGELADGFKLHFIQQQKANFIRKADEDGVLKRDIIIFPICNLNVKTPS